MYTGGFIDQKTAMFWCVFAWSAHMNRPVPQLAKDMMTWCCPSRIGQRTALPLEHFRPLWAWDGAAAAEFCDRVHCTGCAELRHPASRYAVEPDRESTPLQFSLLLVGFMRPFPGALHRELTCCCTFSRTGLKCLHASR